MTCDHGRPLSICAICAPAADALYQKRRDAATPGTSIPPITPADLRAESAPGDDVEITVRVPLTAAQLELLSDPLTGPAVRAYIEQEARAEIARAMLGIFALALDGSAP